MCGSRAVRSDRRPVPAHAGPLPATPVAVSQSTLTLPTYEEDLPDVNPRFDLFARRPFLIYPYTARTNLTDRRAPKAWRTLVLENEYLRLVVLPDLGGRIYSCVDKSNGQELFYANTSIKYADVAYRGAWVALGVEFNFPVSHNWMTVSPVDFATARHADGSASIFIGNTDRPYGMTWRVELALRPGRSLVEQTTTLYNRSDVRHRFYWWTTASVRADADSRILYPMQFTAAHHFADVDTWPVDSSGTDLSRPGNHRAGFVSRFAYGSREPFMGVYRPATDSGVVHVADHADMPGKKIWSWGWDDEGQDWRRALSDDESAYLEVQAGLFRNQETYAFLEPGEVLRFRESYQPVRKIGGWSRANDEGVLHLRREAGGALRVGLNVTRAVRAGRLVIRDGARTVREEPLTLTPAGAFDRSFGDLTAAGPYTVELRDAASRLLLTHTENGYDFTPEGRREDGTAGALRVPAARTPERRRLAGARPLPGAERQAARGARLLCRGAREPFPRASRSGAPRAASRSASGASPRPSPTSRASSRARATTARLSTISASPRTPSARRRRRASPGTRRRRSPPLAPQRCCSSRPSPRARATLGRDCGSCAHRSRSRRGGLRAGGIEVALLRRNGRTQEAKARLRHWLSEDPADSLLRHEGVLLGAADPSLWPHLASDPERVLALAADYMALGLWGDARALLARSYPAQGGVSEPGAVLPQDYPARRLLPRLLRGAARPLGPRVGRARLAAVDPLRLPEPARDAPGPAPRARGEPG